MGEGWGDAFATFLRMRPFYNRKRDFLMGSYSFGGRGIRKFPYSTNMTTSKNTHNCYLRLTVSSPRPIDLCLYQETSVLGRARQGRSLGGHPV